MRGFKRQQKVARNRDKSADVQEVQDVAQVCMIASKEYVNKPIGLVSYTAQFSNFFPVKTKNGQACTSTSFMFLNSAPSLPKGETYETKEEVGIEEEVCDIAQVNCVTIEEEKEVSGDE